MKLVKCLALISAFITSLTLTSCLGGEDDPNRFTPIYLTKVNYGYMGFSEIFTTVGRSMSFTPTESSVLSYETNSNIKMSDEVGKIGLSQFYWNTEEMDFPDGTTELSGVNLNLYYPLDESVLIVRGKDKDTARDSVATHPIITLNPDNSIVNHSPFFFDDTKQDIILYADYLIPYDGSGASSASTTLVYYPDDEATQADKANNILRLYFNYTVRGIEDFSSDLHAYNYPYYPNVYIKAFRLNDPANNIMQEWRAQTGNSSFASIRIVTKENQYSTDMDNSGTKENSYLVRTWQEANGEGDTVRQSL